MAAAINDSASDPRMNHASKPTTPPVATEPISLPKMPAAGNAAEGDHAEDDERECISDMVGQARQARTLPRLRRGQRLAVDHAR